MNFNFAKTLMDKTAFPEEAKVFFTDLFGNVFFHLVFILNYYIILTLRIQVLCILIIF